MPHTIVISGIWTIILKLLYCMIPGCEKHLTQLLQASVLIQHFVNFVVLLLLRDGTLY